MSQELWLWAKAQVLASLRSPYGLEAILPAPKKASPGTGDRNGESVLPPTTAQLLASCKAANPMKASRTRQDLHKELLLTHRKGLVLHSKPELLRVLERRRCQERLGAEPTQDQTPLQQELLRWQQRREEVRNGSEIAPSAATEGGGERKYPRVPKGQREPEEVSLAGTAGLQNLSQLTPLLEGSKPSPLTATLAASQAGVSAEPRLPAMASQYQCPGLDAGSRKPCA
ncbi:hypothetical protein NDU88_000490 [Pleurodeles waltl]|uniref:Uncharacterized protein n=1 Tax=Pleurodeles waltl TaxID=8319 RepID=A0AAV7LUV8_PLEWA|nr:hypothetical protein NDU88_000490 [Pleurodeles waltl]